MKHFLDLLAWFLVILFVIKVLSFFEWDGDE